MTLMLCMTAWISMIRLYDKQGESMSERFDPQMSGGNPNGQNPQDYTRYSPEQTRYSFKSESEQRKPAYQVDRQYEEFYDPRMQQSKGIQIPGETKGQVNYASHQPQAPYQGGMPGQGGQVSGYPQGAVPQGYPQGYPQQTYGQMPYAGQNYPQMPQGMYGYPEDYPRQNLPQGGYAPQQPYGPYQGIPQQPYGNQMMNQSGYPSVSSPLPEEKEDDYDYEGYESFETRRERRRAEKAEAKLAKLQEKQIDSMNSVMMGMSSQMGNVQPEKKKKNIFGGFLLTIQFLLTGCIIALLLMMDVLPMKYFLIGCGALFGLWLLMLLFQNVKATRGFGKGCSIFLILLLGLGTFYLWQTNAAMSNMFAAGSIKDGLGSGLFGAREEKADKPFVVYLTGNDSYGEVEGEGRSDVNILMAINPSTGKIAMVTTPRDAYLNLPDYVGGGAMDKLTHVGIYGIDASMDVLSDLYDVDVDCYVRVNFSGFQGIVDALGGVTVKSDMSFTASGGYYFDAGENQVNGEEALAFVRERYAFGDGDFQRGRNQMLMIQAIIDKATSPSILMNYTSFLDAVDDCMLTDMSQQRVSYLVKQQLSNGTNWQIESMEVSGWCDSQFTYSGGEASVVWLNDDSVEAAKEMLQRCLNGEKGE